MLLSEHDFKLISKFNIDPLCEWSDHCSLSICLSLTDYLHPYSNPDTHERFKVSWSDEHRVELRRQLVGSLPAFNAIVNNVFSDAHSLNRGIREFTDLINNIAKPFFHKHVKGKSKGLANNAHVYKKAEWFDDECRQAKCLYFKALGDFIPIS